MTLLKIKKSKYAENRVDKLREEVTRATEFRDLNLRLDRELIQNFKIAAIRNNTTMTGLITDFISSYLKNLKS
jgi:ParG protein